MRWFSTQFIGMFIGLSVIVVLIIFDWLMMIFFTTNLIVRVLKSNVINNLQSVLDNSVMVGFIATAIFGALFSISFEIKAFVFALHNKEKLSIKYATASGVLSLLGVIMVIPPDVLTFSLQGVSAVLLYALLAFTPSFSLILLAGLLYEKLTTKMADGTTLIELVQKEFEQGIKEYFAPPKPKENPFTQLLTNNTEKSTITPYKRETA